MRQSLLTVFFLFFAFYAGAQVYTNKEVGQKNQVLADSLKRTAYPYALPILGAKATKAGFNLPYSAGISTQYFWQRSDIIIDNLNIGFNNGPMVNVDGLVRFDKAVATASALTVRPDIWLLPFLNVYAILGKTSASTEVGFGIWIPDSTNTSQEIFSTGSKVDFNATSFGIGFTPTIGVAGGFLALDMNVAWTDVPQLSKPARTFVFGPRFGKTFRAFHNKESNIALWVGGFRVALNSETNGAVNLSDVISEDDFGAKVDQGIQRVDNAQQQVDTWWNNLTPAEQSSPVNQAKYETANAALERAGQFLSSADQALNNIANSSVQYSMDKRPKDLWNFIIGSQYQVNKHWMIRAEVGMFGSRVQAMTGLQYRFGL